MSRKRGLLTVLCMALWLTAGMTWAGQSQSVGTYNGGQTDIMAGVIVDYMGKLRFEVYQRGTTTPIEGASVELYVTSLERYVLLGMSDANGVFELDIAYNTDSTTDLDAQFQTVDGTLTFKGTLLYLNNNELQYQIYKSGWLPYPYQGTVVLAWDEIPQVITVYLYKQDTGGGGNGGGGGGGSSTSSGGSGSGSTGSSSPLDDLFTLIDENAPLAGLEMGDVGGIPKTGVEGAIPYWIAGVLFFLLAGGILVFLWKKEQGIEDRERRYRDEQSA